MQRITNRLTRQKYLGNFCAVVKVSTDTIFVVMLEFHAKASSTPDLDTMSSASLTNRNGLKSDRNKETERELKERAEIRSYKYIESLLFFIFIFFLLLFVCSWYPCNKSRLGQNNKSCHSFSPDTIHAYSQNDSIALRCSRH
jgi:hypothetical protein